MASPYFGISNTHTQVANNADESTVLVLSGTNPFFVTKLRITYASNDYASDDCIIHVGFSNNVDGSNPIFFTGAYKTDFTESKYFIEKVTQEYSLFIPAIVRSIVLKTNTKTGNRVGLLLGCLSIPSDHQIISKTFTSFGSVSITGTNSYPLTSFPSSTYKTKSFYYSLPSLGTGNIAYAGVNTDISTTMFSGSELNQSYGGTISTVGAGTINTGSVSPTTLSYWITAVDVSE